MSKKIAYVTDIHLDETPEELNVPTHKNWNTILNDISKRGINDIVIGGDIGIPSSHKWFFNTLSNYKVDITLGNHDNFNDVLQYYTPRTSNQQKELFYSYALGSHKFIFMDSSAEVISPNQLVWFKKEILTSKTIVLFIHHSILSVNTEVDKRFSLKNRDEIKKVLINLDNEVFIFSGHYHFDNEKIKNNIHQYITPACSFQVEKIPDEIKTNSDTFSYRILNISNDGMETELVLFQP